MCGEVLKLNEFVQICHTKLAFVLAFVALLRLLRRGLARPEMADLQPLVVSQPGLELVGHMAAKLSANSFLQAGTPTTLALAPDHTDKR